MCFDCREFVKDGKIVEKIRDQIVIETIEKNKKIRNRESNTQKSKKSIKHPEAEQRKHSESEDKTNKNRQKSIVENSIENENKQSGCLNLPTFCKATAGRGY